MWEQSCPLLGFPLPNDRLLSSITNKDLFQQTGVAIGSRLHKIGVNLIVDPSLNPKNEAYSIYGKYLAQGYFTEGIIPVYASFGENTTEPGALILDYQAPLLLKKKFDYSAVNIHKMRKQGVDNLVLVREPEGYTNEWMLHALTAGADMVITSSNPEEIIKNIKKWIRGGKLSAKDLDKKYDRVMSRKFGSAQPYLEQSKYLDQPNDAFLVHQMQTAAIALTKNKNNLLPFRHLDTLDIALIANETFPEFSRYNRKYGYQFEFQEVPSASRGFDVIVASVGENTTAEEIIKLEALSTKTAVVIVAMGVEDLKRLSSFDYVIVSSIANPEIQKFMPQVLYGATSPKGQWIGELPSSFHSKLTFDALQRLAYTDALEANMDPKTLSKIDGIVAEAIQKGATPGAQVLVARNGKVVYDKSFGYYSYQQEKAVDESTIYDLASVTKVLATLQTVMFMSEKGIININEPLSKYLPELKGSNKEGLVIKEILLHQAGLRPWLPFWQETMDRDELSDEYYRPYHEEEFPLQVSNGMYASTAIRDSVWHWIIDSRLMRKKPGESYGYRYSDMGFYMMHQLAERMLNQPLNEFVSQNLYDPLGMTTTSYLPLCKFDIDEIAPTALDAYFRKQLIAGLVHDEGAAMFGGVAGHSGLFSNSNDIAKLLQMLLWKGEYGGLNYYKKETIELFSEKQVKENRRGLGWDKPNVASWKSPTSEYASAKTFGHTGFTGTAVWVDPEFDLIYVFLSNRINPDAENTKLMKLNIRSRIQDVIYKSIFELDQYKVFKITPEP